MEIQLVLNGEESGPHSLEEVQTLLANGDATLEDYAWFDGCADWITIAEIPSISDSTGEEIEAEESEAPSTEENADIYVWPDGAEDWVGPNTLAVVQEMIANGEAAETDYAAFEGSSEGATVADIPGFSDAQNEATEESIEEDVVEEEPVPAKKGGLKKGGLAKKGTSGFGAKKGGLKKGGLAKKGASGFGAKKSGGTATKKGAVKKASKAASKTAATPQPTTVSEGEISDKGFTVVYILAWLIGYLGIHRFMVGKIGSGVAMLLTLGGLGVWWLVDLVMLALGNFKDKEGRPIVTPPEEGMSDKNLGMILVLFIFLAFFGIHRFMAGKVLTGILFIITLGGIGIWALIDLISMASGNFKDKEGRPIRHIL